MRKTKLVALLLAVAMIASMVVPSVAAEGAYTVSVVDNSTGASTIDANAGDKVTLKVVLSNNPGISSLALTISRPEGWTITAVANKKLFETAECLYTPSETTAANPYYSSWIMPYGTTEDAFNDIAGKQLSTENGTLLQIQFQIPEDAVTGTYTVDLDTNSTSALAHANYAYATNSDGTIDPNVRYDLALATESLTINVTGTEAPAAAGCEKHGEVAWTEIAENVWADGGALEGGHYKLTGNQNLTAALSVAADTEVCIDLNGCTIAATGVHRTISNSGNLSIMDSSENETGTIKGSESVNAVSGANIYTETGTFNLYGGTISGGHTVTLTDGYAPSSSSYTNGGNLYISSGIANIHGGTITGGHARRGGNIFANNGTLNMYGGTVTEGVADRGGNIYSDATVNVYGGTVSKGVGGWGGANLFVYGSANSINVYGGSILNGGCSGESGSAINSVYSKLYIYGGIIDNREGQNPAGAARRTLISSSGSASSGTAVTHIYGGTFYGSFSLAGSNSDNKVFNGKFTVDVSAYLTDCACMQIVNTEYVVWNYDDTCTDCDYEAALTADASDDKYAITQQAGVHTPSASGTATTGYACAYCGVEVAAPTNTQEGICAYGDHGTVVWLPWDGAATDGHYYVEADMTLNGQINIASGEVFCLDLNGKTVTAAEGKRMFEVNSGATFNLMDLADNGKLVGATSTTASGAVVRTYNVFNLYSGTIVGGHVEVESTSNYYAGAIYVAAGTFNMTGGTVTGGKVTNTSTGTAAGGNLYLTGGSTTVLSGGVIEDGEATTWGGNISINTGAQVTISGTAIIRNGSASVGENIYIRGESADGVASRLELREGATISAGATEASDIAVNTNPAVLVVYEGVILSQDVKEFLACEAQLYDASEGVYKTYDALTDALANAVSGDKVTMGADVEVTDVVVKSGATLDLNGNILTAGAATSASTDAHIIDSIGTAKLVVEKLNASFMSTNNQLPVYNDGAYTFEDVAVKEQLTVAETTATYKFYIDGEAAQTLLDDAILAGNGVSIDVYVTWKDAAGVGYYKTFTLGTEMLEQYAGAWDTKMIVLTISDIEGITDLDCTARVISGGVTVEA